MVLIEANGAVVDKDELISRVWPGRVIEDGNLRAQIRALRMALADHDVIRTVAGRGYQFTAEVRSLSRSRQAGGEDEAETPAPVVAPGASIMVLPFVNLSDDRERQYFADAITEDLTTDLSRLSVISVISRNTAFTYRDRPADTKQIGREVGVRYVLGGSVQRSGNRVRVSAQLIDPRPTRICGPTAWTATRTICSGCKTRSQAELRSHFTSRSSKRRPPDRSPGQMR
jgi:TolB-like protein